VKQILTDNPELCAEIEAKIKEKAASGDAISKVKVEVE
jgi:hypothetical protein